MAVSFDLFGTLVEADRPDEPAAAIARELREQGVEPPADWQSIYWTRHIDAPEGAELTLSEHVVAALSSQGIEAPADRVEQAVLEAFTPVVETRPTAVKAVEVAARTGPVAVCSNCSIPGLVERAIANSAVDAECFDAIVSSADSGWRKPHPEAFERLATQLGVPIETVTHIGDTPEADGGIEALGGTAVILDDDTPLVRTVDQLAEQ